MFNSVSLFTYIIYLRTCLIQKIVDFCEFKKKCAVPEKRYNENMFLEGMYLVPRCQAVRVAVRSGRTYPQKSVLQNKWSFACEPTLLDNRVCALTEGRGKSLV